jgi:hypothetical protein
MKLTPEQIQAKLDSFNKEYKESGLTDSKISKMAAIQANKEAGIYKKSEEHKKAMINKYGNINGPLNTESAKSKAKATRIKKYGSVAGLMHTPEAVSKRKNTCERKYGTSTGMLRTDIAEKKRRKVLLERYGSETGKLHAPETIAARIEKYGSLTSHMNTPEMQLRKNKPVIQFDKQNNFLREWSSGKDASVTLGIGAGDICTCCKGKQKTAGGFIWKYKNEQ